MQREPRAHCVRMRHARCRAEGRQFRPGGIISRRADHMSAVWRGTVAVVRVQQGPHATARRRLQTTSVAQAAVSTLAIVAAPKRAPKYYGSGAAHRRPAATSHAMMGCTAPDDAPNGGRRGRQQLLQRAPDGARHGAVPVGVRSPRPRAAAAARARRFFVEPRRGGQAIVDQLPVGHLADVVLSNAWVLLCACCGAFPGCLPAGVSVGCVAPPVSWRHRATRAWRSEGQCDTHAADGSSGVIPW